tara:strand:- start:276 stop:587 length:312 start_codon:yes stop_codon:yes gene_type:complete
MNPPDETNIHPYLDRLLAQGIKTEKPINPAAHCLVFALNLTMQEHYTVEADITTCTVKYGGYNICEVRWINDGVEFLVYRDCYPLLGMMAAILNTINELREGN